MRWRGVASIAVRTVLALLVGAFAAPVIESLISGKAVEEIVPHWGIHLVFWGPMSLMIGVVAELAYVGHVRRVARNKAKQGRVESEGTNDK